MDDKELKEYIDIVLKEYDHVKDFVTQEEFFESVIKKARKDIVKQKNLITLGTILVYMFVIFAALSFIDPLLIRNIIVSVAGGVLFWVISMGGEAYKKYSTKEKEAILEGIQAIYKKWEK